MKDTRVLTAEDLVTGEGVTAGEVLDVLGLDDEALLRHAVQVLREGEESPELRRLVAWRLEQLAERIERPRMKRRGRPRTFDPDLAREFIRLRKEGASFEEATAALSSTGDPYDRTPWRKTRATKNEAFRRVREFTDLLSEALAAMRD